MRRRVPYSGLVTAIALGILVVGALEAEEPLVNDDVIALCKAGLSDDLVVAKIKQADAVAFQLEPEDLVALHEQGVSERVVTAMLERATPKVEPSSPARPMLPPGMPGAQERVSLASEDGRQALTFQMGSVSMTGFGPVQFRWLNISGTHAGARSTDRSAALVVQSATDPADSADFTLVRLKVDEDDRVRSLKLGSGRAFRRGAAEFLRADEDFVLGFATRPAEEGLWRIQPASELEPGEYGLYNGGAIYGFGID